MSIEKWNDECREGKVIIVRRPHQMPYKVTEFYDLEDALKAYSDGYFEMPSLNEQIKDGQLDIEYDKEIIESIKNNLKEAGIDENTPYYEVDEDWFPEDKYKTITKENELKILSNLVADDMHAGSVFITEKGMTNLEFAEEIFRWTRGHNEPSFESIAIKLFDTDELSLFRNAIENDDKEEFEELLKNKKELINVHDEYGRTPLMNAVMCNDIEKMQQLIKNGANIDDFERSYDKWSKDSLSIAFFKDKKEIFQELLKAGANPYNENKTVYNHISLYEQLKINNYKNKEKYLNIIKNHSHLIYSVDDFKHDILKNNLEDDSKDILENFKNLSYIEFLNKNKNRKINEFKNLQIAIYDKIYDKLENELELISENVSSKIDDKYKNEFIEYATKNNKLSTFNTLFSKLIAWGNKDYTIDILQKKFDKEQLLEYNEWKSKKKTEEFKDRIIENLSQKNETKETAFILKIKNLTQNLTESEKNKIFEKVIKNVEKQVKLLNKNDNNINNNNNNIPQKGGRK